MTAGGTLVREVDAAKVNDVQGCAEAYIDAHRAGWRNEQSHARMAGRRSRLCLN